MRNTFLTLAVAATCSAIGSLTAMTWNALVPVDTYSVIYEDSAGSLWVVDTGLTLDDCRPYAAKGYACQIEAARKAL